MSKNAINECMNQKMRKKINCPVHSKCKCCRYVQPARPDSFKPIIKYGPPQHALESCTIYNASYPGVDADVARGCRPEAFTAKGNLNLPSAPLEKSTTMNLSYRWDWPGSLPPEPFRPHGAITLPTDPMLSMTTHRHDYEKKPFIQSDIIIPMSNISLLNAKLEDKTITSESYQKPENTGMLESFKPKCIYKPPTLPMDRETINNGSYVWPPLPPYEKLPWIPDRKYRNPELPMQEKTIYNTSYLPPGMEVCDMPCQPNCGELMCTCDVRTATEDID